MSRPGRRSWPSQRPDLLEASLRIIGDGQAPSGAFVASPTFSQYGYAWLRDGAFVAEALDLAGERERSARFHGWVAGLVTDAASDLERGMARARLGEPPAADEYLHCRYDLAGNVTGGEWHTFQLDGPGIWLWSLARHVRLGGELSDALSLAIRLAAHYLAALWHLPCADAWEESPEHIHTSTLAAIRAGLDAAAELDRGLGDESEVADVRGTIAAHLATHEGAFVKWTGSDEVDASLLWMAAPYETLDATEPRFAATLTRIEAELLDADGGVHRYRNDTFYGGGAWPVLTSAYGRVMLRRGTPGDLDRARAALCWIEDQADAEGHLPEQVATHALAPGRVDEWRQRWGGSARPLLWSQAAYLALRLELATFGHEDGATRPVPGGADDR